MFFQVRWAIKKWGPQSGEGPPEECASILSCGLFQSDRILHSKLESGFFSVTNVSTSKSADSKIIVKTTFHGQGDPGYLLTSSQFVPLTLRIVTILMFPWTVMISECALSLVLEPRNALPALGKLGGVLTPATALGDVLVKRLESTGRFRFESKQV
jgi:hypothetical protein